MVLVNLRGQNWNTFKEKLIQFNKRLKELGVEGKNGGIIRAMNKTSREKYIKNIPDSAGAYALLKPITDSAQSGDLKPWSPAVIELLESFDVSVERLKDVKVQANLSFPTSTKNPAMAIGFRYAKSDGSFAEDIFLFEEGVGLTCYYRGTQEDALPEYDGTHHAKIVLTELLPDIQRELAGMRKQIKDLEPLPEVSLMINARANNNQFDVTITADGSQYLVAERIEVNGLETKLNQQFSKMYPVPHVNIPDGIFDIKGGEIPVFLEYRTLDGKRFRLSTIGEQEFRHGDGRYNVIFPTPAKIERIE